MAGFVACSASRLAASSARGIQAQLRSPPLLIAATVVCKQIQRLKDMILTIDKYAPRNPDPQKNNHVASLHTAVPPATPLFFSPSAPLQYDTFLLLLK